VEPIEDWQVFWGDEDLNASGNPWLSSDQRVALEAKNHLMDRGRTDAEVALHVGFGWGLPEHARIDVDEGQIVALFFSEAMRADTARGA
jgi:hypothetical protein